MAENNQYNFNPTSPTTITRELYTGVGSGDNFVGEYPYAIFGGLDFEIWTAPTGGTQLTENTDYELRREDDVLTARIKASVGKTVYGGYRITNPTYQSGNIYITYKIVASYDYSEITNDLRNAIRLTGYISGYEIANNSTDSAHDIDISPGTARNDADDGNIILSASITKQIDAAWSAGTNAGGLDTGTVAADTFYYIWAIYNPTTLTTDILFSLSQTSPTMPSGYTKKRRIRGALLTDGSADIIQFFQKDDYFYYDVMQQDYAASNYGTAAVLITSSVPPGFLAIMNCESSNSTGTLSYHLITATNQTNTTPGATSFNYRNRDTGYYAGVVLQVKTDSSSQIRLRSSATAAGITSIILTIGFIDSAQS